MRYLFTLFLINITSLSFAQSVKLGSPEAKKSIIAFNGNSYNGHFIEFNANQQIVIDAIKEQFKLQGIKPTETKGFLVYRNLVMPAIDPKTPMDAFIKVERKLKNLKSDIEYNKNAGERQAIEVEKAKMLLEVLIANNPSKEKI